MIRSLNRAPLHLSKVQLMHRLKPSRAILASKNDQTRLSTLMANNSQVFVHLVGALGNILDPALTRLIYHDWTPLPRNQIKLEQSLTERVPFRASEQIQAVLKVTDRMSVHGRWYRLFAVF